MALTQPQLVELNSKMNQVFSLDEIESLCFDMGIDFESLPGGNKGSRIRELIEFCRRRGRDKELAAKVRAERPQVAWPGGCACFAAVGGRREPVQLLGPRRGWWHGKRDQLHRRPTTGRSTGSAQPQPAKRITILFLAANPKSTDRLRLDEEVRTIDERLRLAQYRDRFNLVQQWAVRTGDILDAMLRYRPDIVHFSGHGSTDGALIFENAAGAAKPVSAAALGALFEALEGVRCVVMNGCWSTTHAGADRQIRRLRRRHVQVGE